MSDVKFSPIFTEDTELNRIQSEIEQAVQKLNRVTSDLENRQIIVVPLIGQTSPSTQSSISRLVKKFGTATIPEGNKANNTGFSFGWEKDSGAPTNVSGTNSSITFVSFGTAESLFMLGYRVLLIKHIFSDDVKDRAIIGLGQRASTRLRQSSGITFDAVLITGTTGGTYGLVMNGDGDTLAAGSKVEIWGANFAF